MTQEQKTLRALRQYWKYLNGRLLFIRLSIIDVSDVEFKRICTSLQIYKKAFYGHSDFKKWLLDIPFFYQKKKNFIIFYALAVKLKNDILECEQ